jgi:asparagine synthetase B (glutamine-hydrolysing)
MDIEGGGQPMSVEHKGELYTIVYNGEVYNTDELKKELLRYNIKPKTRCDTELVLWSYVIWGEDCPKRLNGIFSFAVHKSGEKRLFLARDRFGIKPLYYTFRGESFLFASEIKALFESFGKVVEVSSEKMIDEMIAVTSSSPAYFCMMIDAMADAGVKAGFTRKDALFMAEQAMLGTAKYLIEKEKHPGVLKDEVCSPAGTTIEAVAALEREGFRRSIMAAMDDCRKKAVKKEGYV